MPYEDIEYKPGTDSPVVGILKGGGGAETKAPPLPLPTNQNHRPGDAVYADVEEMRRRKLTPGGSIAADPVEDDYDFVTTTATTTAAINGTPTREEERGGQEEEEQEEYSKHLRLKSVSERNGNALLQRRLQHAPSKVTINDALHSDDEGDCLKSARNGSLNQCERCHQGFALEEEMVNSNGQIWHTQCFVCVQCFQTFPDGVFYEFDGRKYCEHDFNVLFAPCCNKCGEFIIGRVIKAMHSSWHPDCFLCEICDTQLAESGFINNFSRALCRECNAHEKASKINKYTCTKCKSLIEQEDVLKFKGDVFHAYHFNCENCSVELTGAAREKNRTLYCIRCYDKMGIPICGACRRPVEERVIHAIGKTWHPEHFVCSKCEKPFFSSRHYERKGLAYCETHYHQLFGNICYKCDNIISTDVFSALNKSYCYDHFSCSLCDRIINQKKKFYDFDMKPTCKFCFDKFPVELKKRMKKAYDLLHK